MRGPALSAALLIAPPALLAAGSAQAQIMPGFREPADVAMAVRHAASYGCLLAVTGRPVSGINMDFSLAGEGLHPPTETPADLQTLAAGSQVAVLDAPGGAAWIFFNAEAARCTIVPQPLDSTGMDAVASDTFRKEEDWKPVKNLPGVHELKLRGAPAVRGWYQPAADGRPQMVILERKK